MVLMQAISSYLQYAAMGHGFLDIISLWERLGRGVVALCNKLRGTCIGPAICWLFGLDGAAADPDVAARDVGDRGPPARQLSVADQFAAHPASGTIMSAPPPEHAQQETRV